MEAIRRIWDNRKGDLRRLWNWATGPHKRRWKRLARWAKRKRRQARRNHRIQRAKWWAKKRTVYRRKWRRAKRHLRDRGSVAPESWMANGHEYQNLTSRARRALAIAVVRYDLTCTSITRSWGTGSFHESIPTRGFDAAGPRMTEWQRDLRYGRVDFFELSDLLELFGPDNGACADNGRPYAMAEGSGIESLHDNHVHSFFYG